MIKLELIAGLREGEAYVLELLAAVNCLDITEEDYHAAGLTLQRLWRHGVTVAATDGLIAQIAIRHNAVLIEKDKHFQHFALSGR